MFDLYQLSTAFYVRALLFAQHSYILCSVLILPIKKYFTKFVTLFCKSGRSIYICILLNQTRQILKPCVMITIPNFNFVNLENNSIFTLLQVAKQLNIFVASELLNCSCTEQKFTLIQLLKK